MAIFKIIDMKTIKAIERQHGWEALSADKAVAVVKEKKLGMYLKGEAKNPASPDVTLWWESFFSYTEGKPPVLRVLSWKSGRIEVYLRSDKRTTSSLKVHNSVMA